MRRVLLAILILCAGSASPGWGAQLVYMWDGTTRRGTIEQQDGQQIRLRLDEGGIHASVVIPRSQVRWVETIREPIQAATGPTTRAAVVAVLPPSTAPAANGGDQHVSQKQTEERTVATAPVVPAATIHNVSTTAPAATNPTATTLPDAKLEDMPKAVRDAWTAATTAEATAPMATLEALRNLEAAARDVPQGIERLDALCRNARGESFGQWLGRVHWSVIGDKYKTGSFDLRDVREAERPVLIQFLREKTTAALEPLKSYFPPIDSKTGNPEPFKRKQLEGITVTNAIEVKEKAAYASAVLQGQMKLEPQMPAADRAMLGGQITTVYRILSRANELEPAARMALERAENEKKAAEIKARRDEERARAKPAMGLK